MNSFDIDLRNGMRIKAYHWPAASKPIAVLQIAHGMQEYALRYDHFARWLNDNGIAVYSNDHIGHGSSIGSMDDISHFPKKDDWQRSVDILYALATKIKSDNPGVPVFLLGHSMGSVLVQTYMMRYGNEADGYILSGAIRQPRLMALTGRLLVRILIAINGPKDRSELIISLGYGQYNKHFKPNRTGADWLCSNNRIVDEYIASPLCGVPLTNMFYRNFFYGFSYIANPHNIKKFKARSPVLIVAGEDDPAGFFGNSPLKIKQLLSRYAGTKVELKLYPRFRHEILNETDRLEVYKDILLWINRFIYL